MNEFLSMKNINFRHKLPLRNFGSGNFMVLVGLNPYMIMKGFHVLGFFNQVGFIIAREIKGVPEGSKLAMPEDLV
jgi:hypothetical protein